MWSVNVYYPFGLSFNHYSRENSLSNQVRYNTKEFQDELNLGWFDYIARQYDPAIGRFISIDPLSDASRRWSPYVYGYDNPIRFIDPDGMQAEDKVDPTTKTEFDVQVHENRDVFTETTTTTSKNQKTVSLGDPNSPNPEYIALLGASTITTNGANGIGDIVVNTETTTTVEVKVAIAYDDAGNEVHRESKETTTVSTKTNITVKDQHGGSAGGTVKTDSGKPNVTSNAPKFSANMTSWINSASAYRTGAVIPQEKSSLHVLQIYFNFILSRKDEGPKNRLNAVSSPDR